MASNHTGAVRAAERAWLDVPFEEKDAANAHGARYDPEQRRWYDPRPPTDGLQRWAALPDVPDLLPGEDRSFGSGLFVDLVPSSCWFTNVRTCVSPRDWERLRRMVCTRPGYQCEICGAGQDRIVKRGLEVHERWAYGAHTSVQALRRLICLCTDCHAATHFGDAQIDGRAAEAFTHLRVTTGLSDDQALNHVTAAFNLWRQRSSRTWALDLTMLTDAGITLAPPPSSADRPAAAADTLRRLGRR